MFFAISIILIFLGLLSSVYDFVLLFSTPGTFLDNLTSFTHIWLALGAILIFLGIYRIRTKKCFWKKLKSLYKRTLVVVLILIAGISAVNLSFILNPKIADLETPGDFVILLGGGIDKNGILPDSVLLRVEKTAEYLNKNKNAICVVSGGTLKWLPYPEAPELKRQLVLRGIDESRIFVEDQALDTIQNFELSVDLISREKEISKKELTASKWIIVTSDFHLRRAERLASRMGFTDIKGIACKTPLLKKPHSLVREICAYIKLNVRILLTGKPKNII